MKSKVCISLVILALAVLPGLGMKAAALAGGTATTEDAAASQMMAISPSSMKLEDGVPPELAVVDLEVHRRVLTGTNISPNNGLNPYRPVCNPACTPGKSYNFQGRPCANIYMCVGHR
ncbi:hypothetical protein CFC21_044394 [Triticum aestivum]|uniref:Rapid ALkalinization Factor n=2 Tax=Triticum aestivum TaxID=4565 RepID=A0A9R1FR06_WHEAT|nr:uncharacterized protein LOC123066673 [Triticum aestivum]KAF7033283.1 hypothetical protein CFC21_044394 [Triticum aestivum]CDM86531.1 unnamed protein product [Triticum aestivum]